MDGDQNSHDSEFQHLSAAHQNISGAQMEIEDGSRPLKRVRTDVHNPNSSATSPLSDMPPLSLSILGVEPVDEFIREVADFIYHMIGMLPRDTPGAMVEVEAKIGILRDRLSGNRLNLPVLTETSESAIHPGYGSNSLTSLLVVLSPNFGDFRFESNMTSVRALVVGEPSSLLTLDAETTPAFQRSAERS